VNIVPQLLIGGIDQTCYVLADVTVKRGREHPAENFEPSTLQATLVSNAAVQTSRGDQVTFTLNAPATDPLWDTSSGTWDAAAGTWDSVARKVTLFVGRVTDLTSVWTVAADGTSFVEVAMVAVDPLSSLANQMLGGAETWPSETCVARVNRISDEIDWPITTIGTGGMLATRSPGSAPALDLLDAAAANGAAVGGIYFHPPTGVTTWTLGAERNTTTPGLVFDSCHLLAQLKAEQAVSDIANDCTVSYSGGEARATDLGSTDAVGWRTASISTDLAVLADAQARAADTIARYCLPAWKVTDVVIPSELLDDAGLAESLLNASLGTRVQLSPLPAPAPTTWNGYLEGWSLAMQTPTTYRVTLNLSPEQYSGPLFPWDSATGTWDAASGAWNDHLTS